MEEGGWWLWCRGNDRGNNAGNSTLIPYQLSNPSTPKCMFWLLEHQETEHCLHPLLLVVFLSNHWKDVGDYLLLFSGEQLTASYSPWYLRSILSLGHFSSLANSYPSTSWYKHIWLARKLMGQVDPLISSRSCKQSHVTFTSTMKALWN